MNQSEPGPSTNPYYEIPDLDIAKALLTFHGLPFLAADDLGMSYWQINKRIRESVYLTMIKEQAQERSKDRAENVLMKLIDRDNNLQATMFFLRTRAKERGYSEKTEMSYAPEAIQTMATLMDGITLLQQERKKTELE